MKHKNRSHRAGGLFEGNLLIPVARYYWRRGGKKKGCKVLKLAELFFPLLYSDKLWARGMKSRGGTTWIMIDRGNRNRNSSLNFDASTTVYNYH